VFEPVRGLDLCARVPLDGVFSDSIDAHGRHINIEPSAQANLAPPSTAPEE
jgi:hypothetical protein